MISGGFNYSQIANFDFRTYRNTFWIIFGTSHKSTKSCPLYPLFITKTLQKYKKKPNISLEHFFNIYGLPECCQFWKRRAPKNPEESFNEILKIMDMRAISIKKHEWIFANIVPIWQCPNNAWSKFSHSMGGKNLNIEHVYSTNYQKALVFGKFEC